MKIEQEKQQEQRHQERLDKIRRGEPIDPINIEQEVRGYQKENYSTIDLPMINTLANNWFASLNHWIRTFVGILLIFNPYIIAFIFAPPHYWYIVIANIVAMAVLVMANHGKREGETNVTLVMISTVILFDILTIIIWL